MQTRTKAGRDAEAESRVTTYTCDKDFLLCFLSLHSVHLSHLRLGLNEVITVLRRFLHHKL